MSDPKAYTSQLREATRPPQVEGRYYDPESDSLAADDGPFGQAGAALTESHMLHKQLDELEIRLFGPEPKSLSNESGASAPGTPALAHTIRYTRQRLDGATSRLARILQRL